jgi:hypothetical protein
MHYLWINTDMLLRELFTGAKASTCKKKGNIGASAEASCRSKGLRRRNSEVKVTINRKRKKIGARKIKGKKYGGPLPDYS